ncbi:MAG TPA: hypothetical protein VK879_15980 [Candidatus Sulfomarinibacteraceae bacterium]|nr:hypothetical protein [Candidatus Sulfomarinibacteraceae bacterium]
MQRIKPFPFSEVKSKVLAKSTFAFLQFGGAIVLYVALRLHNLTAYSLSGGEVFIMNGVRQGWRAMMDYIIADVVHPPLFYVLVKIWIGLGGESILWLKLLPLLIAIATLLPLVMLCKALGLRPNERNLALFLMGVNGYLIHYAQEFRMYILLLFWATCSYWLFVVFLRQESVKWRMIAALTAVNVLMVYSHYYGWLVVASEFLVLLLWARAKTRTFFLSTLVVAALFGFWALPVTRAAIGLGGLEPNLDWIPRPTLASLGRLYATFNGLLSPPGSKIAGLLLFALPVAVWIGRTLSDEGAGDSADKTTLRALLLFTFAPVTGVWLLSHVAPVALWIERYFIFVAVPYLILVSVAVFRLRPRWLANVVLGSVIVWSGVAGGHHLVSNRNAWEGADLGSRIPWEHLARQMSEAEPADGRQIPVYALSTHSLGVEIGYWSVALPMEYYWKAQNEDRFEVVYSRDLPSLLTLADREHFWVLFFESSELSRDTLESTLATQGFEVGEGFHFGQFGRVVLLPASSNRKTENE